MLNKLTHTTNIYNANQVIVNHNYELTLKDITDIKELFNFLFEANFPRLKELAKEEAEKNLEKFYSKLVSQLKNTDLRAIHLAFSDPDMQYVLSEAIKIASRQNSSGLRQILAHILIKRIKNQYIDTYKLLLNESVKTISKLTQNQLKLLTLIFLLNNYLHWQEPFSSWPKLNQYLNIHVKPFIDFNDNAMDFLHIKYCGCVSSVGGFFGAGDFSDVLKFKHASLFEGLDSKPDESSDKDNLIINNLDLGKKLISLTPTLWNLHLTSIGIIIAISYYEIIVQNLEQLNIDSYLEQMIAS